MCQIDCNKIKSGKIIRSLLLSINSVFWMGACKMLGIVNVFLEYSYFPNTDFALARCLPKKIRPGLFNLVNNLHAVVFLIAV